MSLSQSRQTSPVSSTDVPSWALAMHRFSKFLSQDFLGGPRPWKFAWVINFQKAGTFFFLGFLILKTSSSIFSQSSRLAKTRFNP